jgi:hypothetical protein
MTRQFQRLPASRPALAFLTLLLVSGPAYADWKRHDSPNFVVAGDASAGDLKLMALRFEAFREALSRVLTPNATASAVPTVVLVFPSNNAFTPFKPLAIGKPRQTSSVFMSRADANYVAFARGFDPNGLRVVLHEYAHLVISDLTGTAPVWLIEGLAEFYSTLETTPDGREAVIGKPVPEHVDRLIRARRLPLNELLLVERNSPLYNEEERQSIFYAQSWALAHMILLGDQAKREQLARFLTSLAEGAAPASASLQAFGTERTDRDLADYINRNTFQAGRIKISEKLAAVDAPVTTLSRAESEALLANLLLEQQRSEEAAARLDKSVAGDASPWVEIVRAYLDLSRNDLDSAEKRLLRLPTDDWLASYFAGAALSDVLERRRNPPTDPQFAAVDRLFAATKKRGDIPQVLARTARLELMKRERPPDRVALSVLRAVRLAPGRTDYHFLYARVLAQQSAYAPAVAALRPLTGSSYPSVVRESANRLLEEIQSQQTAAAAAANAAAPVSPEPPTRDPEPPRAEVIHDFRPTAGGEQRHEGQLERIDCAKGAKGAITLHLRTADGVSAFYAPSLDRVDFITYREDFGGNVTCGPLKEPLRVYLTSRSDAGAQKPIAVAVEFLPKDH